MHDPVSGLDLGADSLRTHEEARAIKSASAPPPTFAAIARILTMANVLEQAAARSAYRVRTPVYGSLCWRGG